jgi:hypothetical protein
MGPFLKVVRQLHKGFPTDANSQQKRGTEKSAENDNSTFIFGVIDESFIQIAVFNVTFPDLISATESNREI